MSNLGSIETSAGTASWFENATSPFVHLSANTSSWTVTGWWKVADGTSTAALLEYASTSTVTAVEDYMAFGVYRLGNGKIRVQFDKSTTSLGYFKDFDTSLGSAPFFLGLVKSLASGGSNTAQYALTIDNAPYPVAYMPVNSIGSNAGENGRFVLGASRRWGTAAGNSPAFATVGIRADDICFFDRAMDQAKVTETYRNGLRSWHECRMFESNSHRVIGRVLVEDGDGVMVDLSDLYGINFVKSIDYQTGVDDIKTTANVSLLRLAGPALNLAPLSETSALNQNASAAYEPLLELRRRLVIEYAAVPNEWNIQGWEWTRLFEGYVDDISYQADTVTIAAVDEIIILEDAFQLDAKPYNYYSGPVLSETHIQNVIDDNVPTILTGSATLVIGYRGGTPDLYTPASTGWVLNYDDTPAAVVSSLVTAVADQIGWTARYKWYDAWQDHRLTYFAPPRLKKIDIESISEDADGFTTITTRTPHGLTEEQVITIAGTTNFNGATTVDQVLAYNEFRTLQTPAGSPATETVGYLTYDAHVTLNDEQVTQYDPLRKNARDIRNAAVVKYNRVPGETATLPVTAVAGGSGSPIQVTLEKNNTAYSRTLAQLQVGQSFEVFGCPDTDANVKDEIASISNGTITGSVNIAAALSATSAGFKSEYLTFKTAFSVSTPSINKYGLRQAAVYEASNGNINTATEAYSLAAAIVSDLAEPTADTAVRIHCAPWFELHDLITLAPDKKQRWTDSLDTAIVGISHHLAGADSYTMLSLRAATSASVSGGSNNAAPTLGGGWVFRNLVDPKRPAVSDKVESAMDDLNKIGATLGGKVGRQFTWGIPTQWGRNNNEGRSMMRHDMFEVHLSTDPDFIPDRDTLVHSGRGT